MRPEVAFIVGILTGVAVVIFCLRTTKSRGCSLSATGLLIGMVIGLSRSPLIGAIGAGLIGVASQMIAQRHSKDGIQSNISTEDLWAGALPMAAFCIVGILSGVTIRVNDGLYFGSVNLQTKLTARGFNDKQVEQIMSRWAGQVESDAFDDKAEKDVDLLSGEERTGWPKVWSLADAFSDPDEQLAFIRREAPLKDRDTLLLRINELQNKGHSTAQVIKQLKEQFGD